LVYVAGRTCNAAWKFAEEDGMLNGFEKTNVA
jgi:hypothetical protein